MTAERLVAEFERLSDAPGAVPQLRIFALDLAVRGRLVAQDSSETPACLGEAAEGAETHTTRTGLPVGWQVQRFGSLLSLQYGKALPRRARSDDGEVPVYGSNGLVGYHNEALTRQSAIIVGRKGSAGALNLVSGPSWTTDVAYYVVPPPCLDLRFLLTVLRAMRLESYSRGVKPGLSRADVYELDVVVPPPEEQRRIVAKIDEFMAFCDELEVTRAAREKRRDRLAAASLRRLTASSDDRDSLRAAVEFHARHDSRAITQPHHVAQLRATILDLAAAGRLVTQEADELSGTRLVAALQEVRSRRTAARVIPRVKRTAADAPLPVVLPDGWAGIHLGDVCDFITSGSRGWAEYYSDTGAKFLRAQNVRFGRLALEDLACVDPPPGGERNRARAEEGDLLVVITGAGVTNPALLDRDLGDAYVSQHLALIRPTSESISQWLLLWLMADGGGRAELVARAYGAGKAGLNLDNLRSLPVALPPLAEQRRIVGKVNELMALCDVLGKTLVTAEAVRARLLESVLHEVMGEDANHGEVLTPIAAPNR